MSILNKTKDHHGRCGITFSRTSVRDSTQRDISRNPIVDAEDALNFYNSSLTLGYLSVGIGVKWSVWRRRQNLPCERLA